MILDQQGNDFALNFYELPWSAQTPLSGKIYIVGPLILIPLFA